LLHPCKTPTSGLTRCQANEYELTTGERYRNAEFSTVRDGQITETQVFFGGRADEGR
jgi:hypothetical protein